MSDDAVNDERCGLAVSPGRRPPAVCAAAPKTAAPGRFRPARAVLCGPSARTARAARARVRRLDGDTLVPRENALGDAGAPRRHAWPRLERNLFDLLGRCTWDDGTPPGGAHGGGARRARGVRDLSLFGNAWSGQRRLGVLWPPATPRRRRTTPRSLVLSAGVARSSTLSATERRWAGDRSFSSRLETSSWSASNPGTQGDAWEPALERLRETRPGHWTSRWRVGRGGERGDRGDVREPRRWSRCRRGVTTRVP